MKKRWTLQIPDKEKCNALYKQLKIRPVYCQMLVNRGIYTFEQAKAFFRPNMNLLHNPFAMKGMQKAVQRIEDAIQNKENILVYGDYDVDGTTAVATVYSFLSEQFPQSYIDFYIPDRYKEGYGISKKGIDYANARKVNLIIVLDCGIKAIEQINYAKSFGIDVIICDHHLPGEQLPDAHAILNPKQTGCTYPFKELSGCGIGYKLIEAIAEHLKLSTHTTLRYLDLVAISTAADIVPMTGENRVLTSLGLRKINENPLLAIKALSTISGLKVPISIQDVIFMIAPRINAAGRLKDGGLAVDLFVEKDPEKAEALAKTLHELNDKRKKLDKDITDEIISRINSDTQLKNRKTTVMFDTSWHKGVIGIAASRVMGTYYRPTIVLSENNGQITGSARSVKGFNIYNALKECAESMERFGGHHFAAGMTLKPEALDEFSRKFEDVVAATIQPGALVPEIEIDAEITFAELKESFYQILSQFAPFGPGNRQPIFLIKNVTDNGFSKIINNKHIRFEIIHPDFPSQSYAGIGFDLSKKFDLVSSCQPFDLCFCLEKNEFAGKSRLQLRVLDIRQAEI